VREVLAEEAAGMAAGGAGLGRKAGVAAALGGNGGGDCVKSATAFLYNFVSGNEAFFFQIFK